MNDALDALKSRLRDRHSLGALEWLLLWDQRTMMPAAGAHHRAAHLGLITRLAHEALIDPEVGRLLDRLESHERSLDPLSDDAGLLRLARRERSKAIRVPSTLRSEIARAGSAGEAAWLKAKAAYDFERFRPALERTLELKHRYIECFDVADEPYDVLLDDHEPDMRTADVSHLMDQVKERVIPLIADTRDHHIDDEFLAEEVSAEQLIAVAHAIISLFGRRPNAWRIDPTAHAFASRAGRDDIRITIGNRRSVMECFAVMHEYGHGLYEHQIPARFADLPIASACSAAFHESQSQLWDTFVGLNPHFWSFFFPHFQKYFPVVLKGVDRNRFYAALQRVMPGPLPTRDKLSLALHRVLRFEIERDLINGELAVSALPDAWESKVNEYLGVDVPDHAHGVLQDIHWAMGLMGYYPTYLLGAFMAAQIWRAAEEGLNDVNQQIAEGKFDDLREWLCVNVHAHGKKFTPSKTLELATGATLDAGPYLETLEDMYGLSRSSSCSP